MNKIFAGTIVGLVVGASAILAVANEDVAKAAKGQAVDGPARAEPADDDLKLLVTDVELKRIVKPGPPVSIIFYYSFYYNPFNAADPCPIRVYGEVASLSDWRVTDRSCTVDGLSKPIEYVRIPLRDAKKVQEQIKAAKEEAAKSK